MKADEKSAKDSISLSLYLYARASYIVFSIDIITLKIFSSFFLSLCVDILYIREEKEEKNTTHEQTYRRHNINALWIIQRKRKEKRKNERTKKDNNNSSSNTSKASFLNINTSFFPFLSSASEEKEGEEEEEEASSSFFLHLYISLAYFFLPLRYSFLSNHQEKRVPNDIVIFPSFH